MFAEFWLDSLEMAYNGGYPAHEVRRIRSMVLDNQVLLLEKWNDHFRRKIR